MGTTWQVRFQLRDATKLAAWVNTIGLNLYRQHARVESRLRDLREHLTSSPMCVAAIDAKRILERAPASDRVLLERRYLDGCSVREIAREAGATEPAMRLRLLRARRRTLQQCRPAPLHYRHVQEHPAAV